MNYPIQLSLFNDYNLDDMESDDYEEAYFNYLLDHLDQEMYDKDETFELSKNDNGNPLTS